MKTLNDAFRILNQQGSALIQVMVAAGILVTVMSAAMTFFSNQTKSNNFLEFQSKRAQLRLTILGQFLNNPDNCRCLFQGASAFATPGPSTLTGVAPIKIGRYNIITPGVCPGTLPPAPWIDSTPIDGMIATSIQLNNIVNIGGNYSGDLQIDLQSTKDVLGPKDLPLKIPVAIATTPAGAGLVSFVSCSTSSSSASPALGLCPATLVSVGYDPITGALVCQPPMYQ
ncbi:MAG: hypothetical protein AABZ31_13465 [Bdellovibrionota bacterium]